MLDQSLAVLLSLLEHHLLTVHVWRGLDLGGWKLLNLGGVRRVLLNEWRIEIIQTVVVGIGL